MPGRIHQDTRHISLTKIGNHALAMPRRSSFSFPPRHAEKRNRTPASQADFQYHYRSILPLCTYQGKESDRRTHNHTLSSQADLQHHCRSILSLGAKRKTTRQIEAHIPTSDSHAGFHAGFQYNHIFIRLAALSILRTIKQTRASMSLQCSRDTLH